MTLRSPPLPPAGEPTDAELAAYVARMCADLRRLAQRPGFRTVAYLLDMARLEAEKVGTKKPSQR